MTYRGQATEEILMRLGVYELGGATHIETKQGDASDRHLSKGVGYILQWRGKPHQHALLVQRGHGALPAAKDIILSTLHELLQTCTTEGHVVWSAAVDFIFYAESCSVASWLRVIQSSMDSQKMDLAG